MVWFEFVSISVSQLSSYYYIRLKKAGLVSLLFCL
nr:MAG TPA: hypothetical protein [Caudoviricetes sp.]DAV19963.1 MAG TPA: hypothetical protein [Caudoviricetes sp.]DAV30135.1 MAG TPA: hypothetical protein [Caudoviricetes sp.]